MKKSTYQRPRVLFLHQGGEVYGSDIIFLEVIKALSPYVEPIIILDNSGPLVDKLRAVCSNIVIQELGVLRRRHFNARGILRCTYLIIRSTLLLARLIKRENISLVYSNTIGVLPGAFATKIARIPHIWHIHEIIVSPKHLATMLSFLVMTLSKKVVAVSNAVATHLSCGARSKSSKIAVIHNGIATEAFDHATGDDIRREYCSSNEILIGIIGRIHYFKGQDYFLDVAYTMKNAGFINFKVLMVGDVFKGYEWLIETLTAKVCRLGLKENIIFCGYRNDVPEILKAVDIVIVPSTLPDPFPIIVLEAMASSKPVVATAHGGLVEMINDGVTGFLVRPDSPEAMAERIIQLAKNENLRKEMGKRGRQQLEALFSVERFRTAIRKLVLSELKWEETANESIVH